MVPRDGAWPDPRRNGRARVDPVEPPPPSRVRRRWLAATSVLLAIGWPSLFVIGLALPDRLEGPRAMVLASALSLFVFERLEQARVRRAEADFRAFARSLDAEDAFASTLFVVSEPPRSRLEPPRPPMPPPGVWRSRAPRAASKRPQWPALAPPPPAPSPSERTTAQSATVTRLPISQRPTVPESMRSIHVDLLEQSRRRDR